METSYVYKWIHKPTQKWYIGSRTNKTAHPDDGYICSSKIVKPMIERNPDEWERKIIAIGSSTDMRKLETKMLRDLKAAQDPMSYNLSNWGGPVKGTGRKVGSTEKIKASELLAEVNKVCIKHYGTTFFGHIVEDYAKALANNDKQTIKSWNKLFYRKQMTIRYNGTKIYDYRDYL
jgi:hypothetical protein